MFKHYFERIDNVEMYPIFSLLVFFGFFMLLLIWVKLMTKGHIQMMKNIPLEEANTSSTETKQKEGDI
ncbi:MAG: cytochrome C oxidase Cbb3 [Cytophagales bacterium]|nr:MAG: cytochrome C oxidase Cbb3 [Cytophagales bacterium]